MTGKIIDGRPAVEDDTDARDATPEEETMISEIVRLSRSEAVMAAMLRELCEASNGLDGERMARAWRSTRTIVAARVQS